MGSLFAVRLAGAGHEVVALDASPEVVSAVREHGIELVEPDATTCTEVTISADGEVLAAAELVIVFVKAQHTGAVAQDLARHSEPSATIVSLQNGWGNAGVIAGQISVDRIVVGVTYHSCTVQRPGSVLHSGSGPSFVGPFADDAGMARAEAVAAVLDGAGIETTASARVRTEIWKKLVLNVATLPVAALTRLNAGELGRSGEQLELVDALAAEAVAVAHAIGLPIDLDERLSRIHQVLAGAGAGKPSMLQDVEATRKTEIETICGAVVREAGPLGIPVPLNTAMVQLVHGIERSWQR
jgi:2-dehydropantoate 2-reductase